MTYHFAEDEIRRRNAQRSQPAQPAGQDRRAGDRRRQNDPGFAGPDRRTNRERRASVEEKPSRWPWLLVAASALMVYDALFHDAVYRKHLIYELNDAASATRSWSANLWKQ